MKTFHSKVFEKTIMERNRFYQFSRGQATRREPALQMRRQLHLHRTYFLPAGAGLIGCKSLLYAINYGCHLHHLLYNIEQVTIWYRLSNYVNLCLKFTFIKKMQNNAQNVWILTVASLQIWHLTTCWFVLPSRLIIDWQTLQLIIGMPPLLLGVYGGGSSSASICDIRISLGPKVPSIRSGYQLHVTKHIILLLIFGR